jgi:GH25 family lysozyme M1 (1,4-beta-N-acetylmuramidase)
LFNFQSGNPANNNGVLVVIAYPDIYSGDAGINLAGARAVCAKVTEGTYYANPYFTEFRQSADKVGAYFFGYHVVSSADSFTAQAQFCKAHNPTNVPIMMDVESFVNNGTPTPFHAAAFAGAYRRLGGIVQLVYLPEWYWNKIGRPSTQAFLDMNLSLVSSNYPVHGYSNNGPGWAAYGNPPMVPKIWQYTDTGSFNGKSPIDFNAFKGTIKEFIALVSGQTDERKDMLTTDKVQLLKIDADGVLFPDGAPVTIERVIGLTAFNIARNNNQLDKLIQEVQNVSLGLTTEDRQIITNLTTELHMLNNFLAKISSALA